GTLEVAVYRITFNTGPYLADRGQGGFYPSVPVVFQIASPAEHYHVPLLLNPYGYSTYRGS
ncbi:MAG: hydroxyisourate hydrolase, partial [Myxococcota bacterium]|nr:hydroxyisourate hydrolase [Myxococcota bacterium]